jgi:hypothetical protein
MDSEISTLDEKYINDLEYALQGLAGHVLGSEFLKDQGLCWCNPFYRGEEWPGHDERCTWIRKIMNIE